MTTPIKLPKVTVAPVAYPCNGLDASTSSAFQQAIWAAIDPSTAPANKTAANVTRVTWDRTPTGSNAIIFID